ncbi:MAG TPA: hypothetical protein VFL47_04465 [Flavisolibacter sp.]|nr:hypothetical protein [Flavisolibacter sp.]
MEKWHAGGWHVRHSDRPCFFGESMFSWEANASKFAFIQYVRQLQQSGVQLIDCQVYTPHVESHGGRLIRREQFVDLLQKYCF